MHSLLLGCTPCQGGALLVGGCTPCQGDAFLVRGVHSLPGVHSLSGGGGCTPCQGCGQPEVHYRMYFKFGENFKLENAGFTDVY